MSTGSEDVIGRASPAATDTVAIFAEACAPATNQRSLWGISPVAPIHFGLDVSVVAQRELVNETAEHIVLLADQPAMLSHGLTAEDMRTRTDYYEAVLAKGYQLAASYVRASDFQHEPRYAQALLSVAPKLPLKKVADALPRQARLAPSTVATPLYPVMQCLDAVFLGADLIIADTAQRKVYDLLNAPQAAHAWRAASARTGRHILPEARPAFRFHSLGVDIRGLRLGESTAATRISIHESARALTQKVRAMYAPPVGQPLEEGRANALLHYLRFSAFPWVEPPVVVRTRRGERRYTSYSDLEDNYREGLLHPGDLKQTLADILAGRVARFDEDIPAERTSWLDRRRL